MASRSTSASVPAYRSATARARSKISGVSTGSGEITRSSRASLPWCSLVSVALQQVAVDELAGEPDPDPAARHGLGVQAGRDEVVEGAVEVGQRDVHGHPGDGQPLAHRLVLRPLRHGSVLPEPRQRLRQRQGEVAAEAKANRNDVTLMRL